MTQQTKVTTTPAQLVLRVVGVAFAAVVLFVLLAVLGNGGGTAEAAGRPAGLGNQAGGDGPGSAAPGRAVADAVTSGLQPPTPVVTPASDKRPPVDVPVPQNLPPVAAPANDVVRPITDAVHPVSDAVVPVTDTVTSPVVDVAGPVVAPVTDAVTPIVEPVVPPVPPVTESVGPVAAPVSPVAAPVPDSIQPNVDIVVPPATGSADPDSTVPAADATTAAPDPTAEPTIVPDLVAGADDDAVASVVEPTIETPAAATTGVDSTTWAETAGSAAPAARSDAHRGAAVDGESARSVSRTTSAPRPRPDPIGPFPGGSNTPAVLPSIVSGLLSVGSSSSSSSSPGDAPVAMLAVLTATAAAMFMLSRRVTAEVSWRSALVLSSVERPG